jgi:hypothetical protein
MPRRPIKPIASAPASASSVGRVGERVHYRTRGGDAEADTLDLLAIRWREGHESEIRSIVEEFGTSSQLEAQQLVILQPRSTAARREAIVRLESLRDKGAIDFVTPVLREPESRTRQILTDEITVRFHERDLPTAKVKALLKKFGATLHLRNEFVPNQVLAKVIGTSGLKTLEVASAMDSADEVDFAAPNFVSEIKR